VLVRVVRGKNLNSELLRVNNKQGTDKKKTSRGPRVAGNKGLKQTANMPLESQGAKFKADG